MGPELTSVFSSFSDLTSRNIRLRILADFGPMISKLSISDVRSLSWTTGLGKDVEDEAARSWNSGDDRSGTSTSLISVCIDGWTRSHMVLSASSSIGLQMISTGPIMPCGYVPSAYKIAGAALAPDSYLHSKSLVRQTSIRRRTWVQRTVRLRSVPRGAPDHPSTRLVRWC